jgi:hypothetical protein
MGTYVGLNGLVESNGDILTYGSQNGDFRIIRFLAAGTSLTVPSGRTFTDLGTFSDPGSNEGWSATVNYGDGSGTQPLAFNGFNFTLNHSYTYGGSYTVVVTVSDKYGGVGSARLLVTYNGPPAPTPTPTSTTTPVAPPTPTPSTTSPSTTTAVGVFATGAGAGGLSEVKVYNATTGALQLDFLAFGPNFTGGESVAVGDLSGDGTPDIVVGAGIGGGPQVNVYNGKTGTLIDTFFAFPVALRGGVTVAVGDVTGAGYDDIIVGAGPGGGPEVNVYDGRTGALIRAFYAFPSVFTGGVRVAATDINGDGRADIITAAGKGGGPQVTVYDGASGAILTSFYALAPSFRGGINIAAGDVNGDGRADIIAGAGPGGGPQVTVFDGRSLQLLQSFYAMNPTFTGGVSVAAVPVNGRGRADIQAAAGPGGGPQVETFDGETLTLLGSLYAYDPTFKGGVSIGGGV